ncbi:IlvGEDA operon leader peptide [Klebsiella pneumoniae]|nr:IlvGEDA operon leader peptide [Klebsiella pneumoniae]
MTALLRVISLVVISVVVIIIPPCGDELRPPHRKVRGFFYN